MTRKEIHGHPSAKTLQTFLDRALPEREEAEVRKHVDSCARCAADLQVWQEMFGALETLDAHAPTPGFAERVLAEVDPTPTPALAARLRAVFLGWRRLRQRPSHPGAERLHDYAEGRITGGSRRRVARHVEACPACRSEVEALRALMDRLDTLGRFAPAAGLADAVMARVRPAKAAAPAPTKSPWREVRVPAWARRLVPGTREAWAAAAGVATAPLTILALVAYTVFSHPTVTVGDLFAFTWWKLAGLAGVTWDVVQGAMVGDAGVFRLFTVLDSVRGVSPTVAAGGALAIALTLTTAAWVLYRNLFSHQRVNHDVAHSRS